MAWSTARKNLARDRAESLGDLQNFIVRSPLFPAGVVLGFFAVVGLLTGAIERIG